MASKKVAFSKKTELYEATHPIFTSVFAEIQGMAKKKPEATLSKTKVAQLNRLLSDIKLIFDSAPEFKYLDLLDDDALPQFSDALVVLAHYDGALKGFYKRHWKYYMSKNQWVESPPL